MKKIVLIALYSCFMRIFLKVTLGFNCQNRSALKKYSQVIIIANHNSHLDTMALMAALPASMINKVHPVAAADYFGSSKLKAFLSRLLINALLIPRKRPQEEQGPDPVAIMEQQLKKGRSLIIFPEGTRGEPEVMSHFKKGIGYLLERYPAIPVVPVFLEGLGKSLPKGDFMLVPFNASAHIADPCFLQHHDAESITRELEDQLKRVKEKESNSRQKTTEASREAIAFYNAICFANNLRKSTY